MSRDEGNHPPVYNILIHLPHSSASEPPPTPSTNTSIHFYIKNEKIVNYYLSSVYVEKKFKLSCIHVN